MHQRFNDRYVRHFPSKGVKHKCLSADFFHSDDSTIYISFMCHGEGDVTCHLDGIVLKTQFESQFISLSRVLQDIQIIALRMGYDGKQCVNLLMQQVLVLHVIPRQQLVARRLRLHGFVQTSVINYRTQVVGFVRVNVPGNDR